MATLEAETRRRCIKSHTPFDGIPFSRDITYITVYRHPIDVHFSMMKHISNMKADILDFLLCDSPQATFERFLSGPKTGRGTDDLTVKSIPHHYRSFARWAHLPNVHFAHYADLSADLPGQIRHDASMIGVETSEELVTGIAQAASFGSMKATTLKTLDGVDDGPFVQAPTFFDSATSNK